MTHKNYERDKWYTSRLLISLIGIIVLTTYLMNRSIGPDIQNNIPKADDESFMDDMVYIRKPVEIIEKKQVIIVQKKRKPTLAVKLVDDDEVIPDEKVEEVVQVDTSQLTDFEYTEDTTLLTAIEPVEAPVIEHPVEVVDEVHDWAEVYPEFPGGEKALLKFLKRHINYPAYEEEMGIEGEVVATFVIRSDGSVGDVVIRRSTSDGFARQAKKVISKMPAWQPGYHNGKAVSVKYSLPVRFSL